MQSVIPRLTRCVATGESSPPGGRWLLSYSDPRLHATAKAARELMAPHCPGLAAAARLEAAGYGAPDDVRRIWLTLTRPGDEPEPVPAYGADPAGDSWHDEGYRLTTDALGITCAARSPRGLLRAAATAAQLLGTGGRLAHGQAEDRPHFAWRGLMVDPARCFIQPADLRRLIDLAALYKLNVLHLHLTDDQAWRIEVPQWPRLTDDCRGQYYSLGEFRDLQDYAAARHVTVVPEIDLPGHCAAAVRAYPELATVPPPERVPAALAALPRPLDPHDPVSRRFAEDAYTTVAAATTGRYVHIGGDESFGLDAGRFAVAVRLARSCVHAAGRRPLGWQETARAGAAPGDIAQFWVNTEVADLPRTQHELDQRPELGAAGLTMDLIGVLARHFAVADGDTGRAIADGASVLLSPQSHLYLDRPYDLADVPAGTREYVRRLGLRSYRPQEIRTAAAWHPADLGLPADQVAGVEATLFGETLRTFGELSTLLLPRLAGVAETAWSGSPAAWPEYRTRLGAHSALWRARGLPYLASTAVTWS